MNGSYCYTHKEMAILVQICYKERSFNQLCYKCVMQKKLQIESLIPIQQFKMKLQATQSLKLQDIDKKMKLIDQFFQNLEKLGTRCYNILFYKMLENVSKQYRCLKRSFKQDTYQKAKSQLLFFKNFESVNDLVFSYNLLKNHYKQMKNPKVLIIQAQVLKKQIQKFCQKIQNKVYRLILQMRYQLKDSKLTHKQKESLMINDQYNQQWNKGMVENQIKIIQVLEQQVIKKQKQSKYQCYECTHQEQPIAICLQEYCKYNRLICQSCQQVHIKHNKLSLNKYELSVLKVLSINSKHKKFQHQFIQINNQFRYNIQNFIDNFISSFKNNNNMLKQYLGFNALIRQLKQKDRQISFEIMFKAYEPSNFQINIQQLQSQIIEINKIIKKKFLQIGQCFNQSYFQLRKLTFFSPYITKLAQPYFTKQSFDKSQWLENYQLTLKPQYNIDEDGIQSIKQQVILKNQKIEEEINVQYANIQRVMNKIDKIASSDYQKYIKIVDSIVNSPPTKHQLDQSYQIKKMYFEEHDFLSKKQSEKKKYFEQISTILCYIQQQLNKIGTKVIFQKQRSLKTLMSMNFLSTGMMSDRGMSSITIKDGEYKWNFDDLKDNFSKYNAFMLEMKQKLALENKVSIDQITIHEITKGSIKVKYSSNAAGSLQLHPFFKYLNLSPQDFDERGNIQFQKQKWDIEIRGGYPYYQPVLCKRYGLKVFQQYTDKGYENDRDRWLKMEGVKGQWAVAFHGVKSAITKYNGTTKLQNILKGRKEGTMLNRGVAQQYSQSKNINQQLQRDQTDTDLVGQGIYVSPHIQQCLSYAGISEQVQAGKTKRIVYEKNNLSKYQLILQCRVRPSKIRIPIDRQQYWVIKESKDIRPYGIILLKAKDQCAITNRYWKIIQNNLHYKFQYSLRKQILKSNNYFKLQQRLRIKNYTLPQNNPQKPAHNPQTPHNPQNPVHNPQPPANNPQNPVHNPQPPANNPQNPVHNPQPSAHNPQSPANRTNIRNSQCVIY